MAVYTKLEKEEIDFLEECKKLVENIKSSTNVNLNDFNDLVKKINPNILIYLNRLSDYIFVLARYSNSQGKKDILWKPGKNR